MKKNITVIGGGSINWMRDLMKDIYIIDEIEGGEIRLADPQVNFAEAVAAMLRKFNELKGKDYQITVHEDYKDALKGSDFVMTTLSPGTFDAYLNDLEIPIKYGIRLPVSMTVGIPGISASIRTVPVLYEIARQMEKLCPDAYLLNVTNPMSCVTRALNMAVKNVKVIGMCHEFHAFGSYLGPMLGLHRPEGMDVYTYLYKWLREQGFEYTVAGINHFIWITKATLKGQDVLPQIRDFCQRNDCIDKSSNNSGAAKFLLCRQFGYLPMAGDRHLIEFYPSLCNIQTGFGMKFNVRKTTVESRVSRKASNLKYITDIAEGREAMTWDKSGEEMTEIIRAIINGTTATAIINAPNTGQITNMPEGRVVETLAVISKNGIIPEKSGELPGAVGSLCRFHSDIQELTVKAALSGDRKLLLEAMSLDPSTAVMNFAEIPALMDELLEANKKWLPRFF